MRRKIWRMSEGQFSNTAPRIKIEPETLQDTIAEGATFNGSFSVICDPDFPTKGLVYCDHPYIYINTPAFNEDNPTINFRISAKYLRAGDKFSGRFIIYSDANVQYLEFSYEVVRTLASSTYGDITNMEDFSELAKRSWKEAMDIFYSDQFATLIKDLPKRERLLYRGFMMAPRMDAHLEEFLVGVGLKERMVFEIENPIREYSFITSNRKESIEVTRNTWGFIRINVTTDADFVTVENNVITNDFFLGSKLSLSFYIHKEKLHEGINRAKITLRGMGITRTVEITASTEDLHEKHHEERLLQKQHFVDLYSTYEDFRLKKMDSLTWAKRTVEHCDSILNMSSATNRLLLRLIKTHALIVKGDRKLALEIINNLRVDIQDKRSVEWAYLLYLGALLEPEEEYVTRLRREIEAILEFHPEDVRIFWFLLFLKRDYVRNNTEKLRALRHWLAEGFDTPLLYAECYELYLEDAYLIDRLDDINYRILMWALKHGSVTKSMADRVFDLIYKDIRINKDLFRLLKHCYEIRPTGEHLKAFISYLLRSGKKDPKYIPIYTKGIESNIRLTGLFEAYLECLPLDYMDRLPQMVIKYFSYNSSVSPERKALVYANIIMYKNDDEATYKANVKMIYEFCLEQMKLGLVDDNLAVCYQDLLDNAYLDSRYADGIQKIAYEQKVICGLSEARRIVCVEDELREPIVSNVVGRFAYVPIYTQDYQIFLELSGGRIVVDEKLFYIEKTLNTDGVYDRIKELSTEKKRFLLHDLSTLEHYEQLPEFYMKEAEEYLFSDVIDPDYLRKNFGIFMGYFRDNAREDVLLAALLQRERYRDYDNSILSYMAGLLMIDKQDEQALSVFREYYLPDTDKRQLLGLIKRIVIDPSESKGEFVLELCIHLLREGFFSEETIEYLVRHFIGTTEDMRLIFKYADRESAYLKDFCERFIVQGLYTETIETLDDEILIEYLDGKPSPMIVEAYISYFSNLYLKKDITPPESVFAILIRQLKLTDSINDACRFAYSKYLCKKPELSRQEREMLDLLIKDQLLRNVYFPFYKDMADDLIMKYHLYDRMYAYYEGAPKRDLVLVARTDSGNLELDMTEVYPGIYVRDMMMFFGENIRYNIIDKSRPKDIISEGIFSYEDVGTLSESRFYLINKMEESLFYKDEERLKKQILSYHDRISAGRDIFKIV